MMTVLTAGVLTEYRCDVISFLPPNSLSRCCYIWDEFLPEFAYEYDMRPDSCRQIRIWQRRITHTQHVKLEQNISPDLVYCTKYYNK